MRLVPSLGLLGLVCTACGRLVDTPDDTAEGSDEATTDTGFDTSDPPDSDGDGVPDDEDECPDFDDNTCENGSCATGTCVCDDGWIGAACDERALAITGIEPATAYYPGQRTVTIAGAGFDANTTARIGGVPCAETERMSDAALSCVVPSGAVGSVDVVVSKGEQEAVLPVGFTYVDFTEVAVLAGEGSDAAGALGVDGAGDVATFSSGINALYRDGDTLYVADGLTGSVRTVALPAAGAPTADATVSTLAGDGAGEAKDSTDGTGATAGFLQPDDVLLGGDGRLYVTDTDWARSTEEGSSLRAVDPTTGATRSLLSGYVGLSGMAWVDGALIVAECGGGNDLLEVAPDGTASVFVSGQGTFDCPYGLALSADGGLLYVTDFAHHQIKSVDVASRAVALVAGSGEAGLVDDADPLKARFDWPNRLAVAGDHLFLTEAANCTVRDLHLPTGAVRTVVGDGTCAIVDGPIGSARLGAAQGLVYDPERGLLLSETTWGWSGQPTSNQVRVVR